MNEKLNNVEWSFTQETGCLTITGTGKMQNWAEHQERPWEEIRDEIRRVRICVGMESVRRRFIIVRHWRRWNCLSA